MKKKPSTILDKIKNVVLFPVIVISVIIFIPIVIIAGIIYIIKSIFLRFMFYKKWKNENKFILFVYSDSPIWHDYIENNILIKIQPYVVTLNWSKRANWKNKQALESIIFKHYAGYKEFNPVAIIIPKYGMVKTISFYRAFMEYKHGKSVLLVQQETLLFELFNRIINR